MKWNQYKIKTVAAAEDMIISTLVDIGIEGAQIEDNVPLTEEEKKQMFVDILPDLDGLDETAYISFYLDTDKDNAPILSDVKKELDTLKKFMDIGEGSITMSQTEDKDWINNWKEFFKQFYIDDMVIIPSWEELDPKDKDKLVIYMDPGTAFGTGKHETTQLCIRQIRKYVNSRTVMLDVGCGSGILSMAALKLGAEQAVLTDLDPCAVTAARENMDRNQIAAHTYEILKGNIIDDEKLQSRIGLEKYDVAAANILAEVLLPLTPVIYRHLKKGGIYITSGIIDGKEETVKKAIMTAGFTIMEITCQGEWVSITARK